jgi:hypothetical protein
MGIEGQSFELDGGEAGNRGSTSAAMEQSGLVRQGLRRAATAMRNPQWRRKYSGNMVPPSSPKKSTMRAIT